MSKERARRREEREAETARRVVEARARTDREIAARRRRARRSAAVRSVLPRGRRRWSRRTREQRAITVVALLAIAVAAYVLLDSWAPRVGVVLLALVATPAIVTMVLDRSTR
jgi:Flp pilus assembly protein TadB